VNSTSGGTVLSPDFKEFIQSLNANDVEYLILGGYAVAIHGHPRYTKDLDVWLNNSASNAEKVLQALVQFGFESLGLTKDDFVTADQMIQLGYPPNRIDLMTYADGLEFPQSYEQRLTVEVDGVAVNFINLADLRKNKRATGRLQDLADLEGLE
jgi:hypothetical protein